MTSAMIIVGAERTFWEEAQHLYAYLRRGTRCGPRVKLCEVWNNSLDDLRLRFISLATRAGRQPFLLAYIGHGYHDKVTGEVGWSYGVDHGKEDLKLPYDTLRDWLFRYRVGPTLVLNDCCYAGALVPSDTSSNPPHERFGFISGAISEGSCYGAMTPDVIDAWAEREVYVPRTRPGELDKVMVRECRSGAQLDHHFFPKP